MKKEDWEAKYNALLVELEETLALVHERNRQIEALTEDSNMYRALKTVDLC